MARATRSRGARSPVRIVARHERLAVVVDEPRAFAAQRLGQQIARRARHGERRRMKLHELEVGDARAGEIRERDAVAGRDRRDWSSRDRPGRRRPSRAAWRAARASPSRPVRVEKPDAGDAPVLDDRLHGDGVIDDHDASQRRRAARPARGRSRGRSRRARAARAAPSARPRARDRARRRAGDRRPRPTRSARARSAGPSATSTCTAALVAQAVAGRESCRRRAARGESSAPTAAAMPPCAIARAAGAGVGFGQDEHAAVRPRARPPPAVPRCRCR